MSKEQEIENLYKELTAVKAQIIIESLLIKHSEKQTNMFRNNKKALQNTSNEITQKIQELEK